MRKLLLLIFVVFATQNVFSSETNPTESAGGSLKGFVFDVNANQPLEYATISMISKREGKAVNGTITDATGFFKIKHADFGMYKIEVSFIGYKKQVFDRVPIKPDDRDVDLGRIELEPLTENIDEAVVVADRPTMTYKIDKKVINVSQQHTSASGTAVEILENIPSITVDIEGNVSLRGSESFTVLIDSKPTVLDPSDALSQIPASAIENIEVITNPSAKFNAEGTSGIINIITKKNKLQGFNGIANLNGGTFGRYGGDILINWRKERINFFVGADFNNRSMEGSRDSENWTRANDTTSYVDSEGDFERGGKSYSTRGGIDLTLNPRNSVSFEGQIGYRERVGSSFTDYNEYTDPVTTNDFNKSIEDSERGGMYYSLNLNYTKKFLKKGHQIYTLINYRHRENDETSENELRDALGDKISGQRSTEAGPSNSYKIQIDYILPIREKNKFEAGYSADIDLSEDKTELYQYNIATGLDDYMSDFIHDVNHDSRIQTLYSMYSGEIGSFGYQAGLRGEYTYRDITLKESGESAIIDRVDFFPTIHLSYSTKNENQWMINYSRRIKRPRGWYLEPFLTWSDAYNVRMGNPDLLPQYINSYELSHLIKFGRNSFSVDAYYRVANNKIERIRSVYDENVYLSTYKNVGKDYSLGIELMLGIDLVKWWHVDLMGNFYDYRVEGSYEYEQNGSVREIDFSESSFSWNTRFNNTIRIGKTTRFQLNGMYNSPTVSAQGERDGFFMTNMAVRQSFYQNKLALALQVRDVFGTMKHASSYGGDDFYSSYEFNPNTPFVSLTLTYKINNYKPDRKRRSGDGDDMGGDEEF